MKSRTHLILRLSVNQYREDKSNEWDNGKQGNIQGGACKIEKDSSNNNHQWKKSVSYPDATYLSLLSLGKRGHTVSAETVKFIGCSRNVKRRKTIL